ncbi:PadR family transcriptional regulator [Paenibacillus oleatilyticus]|uniref:PadR family transcriptional regulator n=1 Tax=Paenibacillus oleatilyticus TaxID=2594886 RepID=UPI001C1F36D6|nr:PadR family transcriptional regulator [Paenibacillus oleatilyticus]MBU7315208.1 PadR family transcriptional regulator [Paenibacillus oleatilyticus]
MNKELLKGSIDILVLSVADRGDTYGYEIIRRLKKNSDELYEMSEGTLYPALRRLEDKGFLVSYWGDSETGGRRKYYRITEDGKRELDRKVQEWQAVHRLIRVCLEGRV